VPQRTSLRDRMTQAPPKGRDALYSGGTSTVDGLPSTVDPPPSTVDGGPAGTTSPAPAATQPGRAGSGRGGERGNRLRSTVAGGPSTVDGHVRAWTEAHKRVTFYSHRDLIRDIERAMAESGRSKSQVIVDALRDHLKKG